MNPRENVYILMLLPHILQRTCFANIFWKHSILRFPHLSGILSLNSHNHDLHRAKTQYDLRLLGIRE